MVVYGMSELLPTVPAQGYANSENHSLENIPAISKLKCLPEYHILNEGSLFNVIIKYRILRNHSIISGEIWQVSPSTGCIFIPLGAGYLGTAHTSHMLTH